jgi:hypothetical protein
MRHLTLLPAVILAPLLAFLCNRTEASLFYDYEEDGTGTVLATLELASLPATHTEVLGLTFTPAGQAIFGFGETYLGTFDTTVGDTPAQMIADGIGGLRSTTVGAVSSFNDLDPPSSLVITPEHFSVYATDVSGHDGIVLFGFPESPVSTGDWRAVPEPSADFDSDGFVTGLDFLDWQQNVGLASGASKAQGDADNNGTVDSDDLVIWETQYGGLAPITSVTSVPEPTTCTLALAALCQLFRRRR